MTAPLNHPTTSPILVTARDTACRLLDDAGSWRILDWSEARLEEICRQAGRLARLGRTDVEYYVARFPEACRRIGDAGRAAFAAGWDSCWHLDATVI